MQAIENDIISYPKLGEGVFLTIDIANILRLPYQKVQYLMKGYWYNESFGQNRNKAVNFHALIEFYTFYQLRLQGLSAQKIKKAHADIAKSLKTRYPFALNNISTDGKSVWYEQLEHIIKADGKEQYTIKSFLNPFLHQIEFGKDNLAARFYPLGNSKNVVVDPKHQFGQPTISGRNITVSAIKKLHEGGESIKNIGLLYDLKQPQVVDALNYYKRTA